MRIRDVMETDVPSVRESTPLVVALELMRWRGARHLPVVRGDRVVGVLSDRDVARALARGEGAPLGGKVADLMTIEVPSVGPETSVPDAASLLASDPVGCLAVVDHGHLLGIVTAHDLMRVLERPHLDTHFDSGLATSLDGRETAWRP